MPAENENNSRPAIITRSWLEAERAEAWGLFLQVVAHLFIATGMTWSDLSVQVAGLACSAEADIRAMQAAAQEGEERPTPATTESIH